MMKRIISPANILFAIALVTSLIGIVHVSGRDPEGGVDASANPHAVPVTFQDGLPIITPTPIPTATPEIPTLTPTPEPIIKDAMIDVVAQYGGTIKAISHQGEVVYIGVGPRLVILQTSDPASITQLGQSDVLIGVVEDIGITGTTAFVAIGDGGVQAIDISELNKPRLLGRLDTPGHASSIDIVGDVAYVVDIPTWNGSSWVNGSLHIIDVADPNGLVEIGNYASPGEENDVQINNGLAYIADGDGGIRVVDVTDARQPIEIGFAVTPGYAQQLELVGDDGLDTTYIYTIDSMGNLYVVDVSKPADPYILQNITTSSAVVDIEVEGDKAYVVGRDGELVAYDVSNPDAPIEIGVFGMMADGISIDADRAYVFGRQMGLRIVDLSKTGGLVELGRYDTSGYIRAVSVENNQIYAVGNGNVLLFDWHADKNALEYTISHPLSITGDDIKVRQGKILISEASVWDGSKWKEGSVQVIDATDIGQLRGTGPTIQVERIGGFAVKGNQIYFAAEEGGLRVLDFTDLNSVHEVIAYSQPFIDARDVAIAADRAYVADYLNGLHILDISDPTTLKELDFVPVHIYATNIDVAGNSIYLGFKSDFGAAVPRVVGGGGLRIIKSSEMVSSQYQFEYYN